MKNWKLTNYSFIAFEKTGIIPRSIYRFFKKLINQFDPVYEYEVIKNFRISKYQTLIFFRYSFTVLFIPFILSTFCKKVFFIPIVDSIWDQYHLRIFLNNTQEKEHMKSYNTIITESYLRIFYQQTEILLKKIMK